MTNEKIKPRIDDDGEPWCSLECPIMYPYENECWDSNGLDDPCIPALRRQRDEARAEAERLRKSASAVEAPTGYYTTEARVVGVQTRPWGGRTSDGVEAEITVRSVLSGSLPGRERTFPPVYERVLVVTTFEESPDIEYAVTSRRCPDDE